VLLFLESHPEAYIKLQLYGLNEDNPESDAELDFGKSNHTCYELNGFAPYMPGVNTKLEIEFCKSVGITNFRGTADVVYSEEHGLLINRARNYAKRYNLVIISKRI